MIDEQRELPQRLAERVQLQNYFRGHVWPEMQALLAEMQQPHNGHQPKTEVLP